VCCSVCSVLRELSVCCSMCRFPTLTTYCTYEILSNYLQRETHTATHIATRTTTHSATHTLQHTLKHTAAHTATHTARHTAKHTSTHTATRTATHTATRTAKHTATRTATYLLPEAGPGRSERFSNDSNIDDAIRAAAHMCVCCSVLQCVEVRCSVIQQRLQH